MSRIHLNDFGVIGAQGAAALVSRSGSIDWCCFPHFDSPSHFDALLDPDTGGRFQITPQGEFRSEQKYLQRTLVLETLFETPHGSAILTDWMPAADSECEPFTIFRRIEMIQGQIHWNLLCRPRFNYGEVTARPETHRDGVLFRGESPGDLAVLKSEIPVEVSLENGSAIAKFRLEAGDRARFTWSWGRRGDSPKFGNPRATAEGWRHWAHRCPPSGCPFAGPWHDNVVRSSLTLKALSQGYMGSVAESVTPSLTGSPDRDCRYAWIRGLGPAVQAFAHLGYEAEARSAFAWICDLIARDGTEGLRPVYRVDGGPVPKLPQSLFRLDTFGHVALAAAEHYRQFHELPERAWEFLAQIADYVCQIWRRPHYGPWETRERPKHYVVSKAYCWAALDRVVLLYEESGKGAPARWREQADIIHRTLCSQGFDEERQSFVASFGESELDSSVLWIPILGLLPFEDPRSQGTLAAIRTELSRGVFLRKNLASASTDGGHIPSSLLLVMYLALSGHTDEAADRLAEICAYSTSLGLLGEQIDLKTEEISGNFPSAAAHVSLINAALYVGAARSRQLASSGLLGTPWRRSASQSALK